jgi:hypothetical protein
VLREDLAGWYILGDSCKLDLTDLEHAVFSVPDDGLLHIQLTGSKSDVWLEIQELVDG